MNLKYCTFFVTQKIQVGVSDCVATIMPTALLLAIKWLVGSSGWKQAHNLTTFHEYARMVGATLFAFANGPVR